MTPCPHCGAEIASSAKICPNCGTSLTEVWPPPPEGFELPAAPLKPKTLTGQIWADFTIGFVAQYLVHLATARVMIRYMPLHPESLDVLEKGIAAGIFLVAETFLAAVLGGLFYYRVKPFYPVVAWGAGYALLLLFAVLLGAFFICQPLLY